MAIETDEEMREEMRKASAEFERLIIERAEAYNRYSLDEKSVYWQGYFVRNLFHGNGMEKKIDVAKFRQQEPDFDRFIDAIAGALAESTGEEKSDIMEHAFDLDETARRYLRG